MSLLTENLDNWKQHILKLLSRILIEIKFCELKKRQNLKLTKDRSCLCKLIIDRVVEL